MLAVGQQVVNLLAVAKAHACDISIKDLIDGLESGEAGLDLSWENRASAAEWLCEVPLAPVGISARLELEAERMRSRVATGANQRPSKGGVTVAMANREVSKYLIKHAKYRQVTIRELAQHVKCSPSTIHNCPSWTTYINARPKPERSVKAVGLTPKLEKTRGKEDEELQRLIEEQIADDEPSPLDDNSAARSRDRQRKNRR